MKLFNFPPPLDIECIVFDIDSTLYTNNEYKNYQNDFLINKLATYLGKDFSELKYEIEARKNYLKSINGKSSLGNIFLEYGVSIQQNCKWRDEFETEKFLSTDNLCSDALRILAKKYRLGALTNNTLIIAEKSLKIIGIIDFFESITTLDQVLKSKPSEEIFDYAVQSLNTQYEKTLFVGDRYEVDLHTPLTKGASGILVDGVEDVYKIPALLINN